MLRVNVTLALLFLSVIVLVGLRGQISQQGVFRSGPVPVVNNCVKWSGPNSITDAGAVCGTGGGTACGPGALDWSLSTGCNIPFYVGGVFP